MPEAPARSEPALVSLRLTAGAGPACLEAEGLVAAAKPSGVPVIAARAEPAEGCFQRRLEKELGRRLFVVHRIDRDASGLVLFATSAKSHRALSLAFEHRRVLKTYRAFVAGSPPRPSGRLEQPLRDARKGKTRPAAPGETGRAAVTDFLTLLTWGLGGDQVSLLELRPLTGRHHQLRVHLRSIECPILFDPLYARGRTPATLAAAPCGRLALHALRLELPAPSGNGRIVCEAPPADDFVALENWLEARSAAPAQDSSER